jgi:hypothetical protein
MTIRTWQICLLAAAATALAAGDEPWKDKAISAWTVEDAKQLLTDSPWAKSVNTSFAERTSEMGGRGGGLSIGIPGIGMGRRGGRNTPPPDDGLGSGEPPVLRLRWESAQPVREAELKARETNAPDIDQNHYAVAVYGVPARVVAGDPAVLARQYKKQASIKRDNEKDLKPESVEVLNREDGPVIVYFFSRKVEITRSTDRRLEFDAQIGRLELTASFYIADMVYQGKLEL